MTEIQGNSLDNSNQNPLIKQRAEKLERIVTDFTKIYGPLRLEKCYQHFSQQDDPQSDLIVYAAFNGTTIKITASLTEEPMCQSKLSEEEYSDMVPARVLLGNYTHEQVGNLQGDISNQINKTAQTVVPDNSNQNPLIKQRAEKLERIVADFAKIYGPLRLEKCYQHFSQQDDPQSDLIVYAAFNGTTIKITASLTEEPVCELLQDGRFVKLKTDTL